MSKISYIESDDRLYILGDNAFFMANIFKKTLRRPMARGVLSPGESEAEKIILLLIESILGKAKVKDEVCYFSVPAAPINKEIDIIYHQAMFAKLIGLLGYHPMPLNESAAIIYSNCAKEEFSGIALSFGSGMCNVALVYRTVQIFAYSILGCGDWIDESAAKAVGDHSITRIQAIKEKGVDLMDPTKGDDPKTNREREAIAIYYKSLILRVLESIKDEFVRKQASIQLPESLPIIVSGGTALAGNFLELFKTAVESVKEKMAIPISEIRLASSPLSAVAQGLLVVALNQEASK